MGKITRLTPQAKERLQFTSDKIATLEQEGRLDNPSADEAEAVRVAVRDILGEITTAVSPTLEPTASVDRAFFGVLANNKAAVQRELAALRQAGRTTPIDYYEIAYKLTEDSGLIHQTLLDPGVARRLIEKTTGTDRFGNISDLAIAEGCDACTVCAACGACGACGACPLTGAVGTGGTLATAGTGGAIAWLF